MILVTGGAGFIGSHLVERLAELGRAPVIFDSFDDYYDPDRKWRNVAPLVRAGKVEVVVGDVRDERALGRALARGAEAVVHLAARPGVRPSLEAPALYADVNATGTLRVLEAARRAGVGEVVLASSSSVYGDSDRAPFREGTSEGTPASPYGASKRAMELLSRCFAELHGLRVTALRLFTAYGPRQRPDMAIHRFARAIASGQPVPLYGAGDTRRDYTFVSDVVEGFVRALGRAGPAYREYNIGREETVGLDDLVCGLERALGRRAVREHHTEQPGDVRLTAADCRRARTELGYVPRVSLAEGLERFVAWLAGPDGV